jgi:peptide/nickel transport system permease protein
VSEQAVAVQHSGEAARTGAQAAYLGQIRRGWRRLRRDPSGMAGLFVVVLLCVVAVLAPLLAPESPVLQDLTRALHAPDARNWLGTDEYGRDILSRLIWGSRITLLIVCLVAIVAAPIGLLVGTLSGFLGGAVDLVLMRVTEVFLSFPSLILALALAEALGAGLGNAILAIALTAWPPIARLARAETLTVGQSDYIAAARLLGASRTRLLLRHILPICIPSVVVRVSMMMGSIVLTAAGLGFLGLGAQPPLPEWGVMIANGRKYMLDHWWMTTVPGVAILIVSLAFNLFGDAVRDLLDPRGEGA